jgi:hypothetical protein
MLYSHLHGQPPSTINDYLLDFVLLFWRRKNIVCCFCTSEYLDAKTKNVRALHDYILRKDIFINNNKVLAAPLELPA